MRTRSFSRPLDFFAAPGVSRATFYHSATPDEIVEACTSRLGPESARVLYRDLLFRHLAEPKRVTTPVLVLTARGTVRDRVEGLDAGAEDYLVKPFDADELLARLRALRRRSTETAERLPIGARTLLIAERRVTAAGQPDIELSPRECDLLQVLAGRPQQVFTRKELLERVFGDADTTGSVDTYVHYLRRKLGHDAVRTVRGSGYRLGPT
jgi:two-component system response regulator QseB